MSLVRTILTVLALGLDVVFLALFALTMLLRHLSPTQTIGGIVILVVLIPNVPALILALVARRRGDGQAAAGVFE